MQITTCVFVGPTKKQLIALVKESPLCLLVKQSINAFNGNRGLSTDGHLMTTALPKNHSMNSFLSNQKVSTSYGSVAKINRSKKERSFQDD
ncbi:hypothetical protein RS9916_31112 [Synechococcus sp. RS9916]|nr:hypothetical protein RS9916_31112 [Synechococcus sp. RS9916]